MADNSKLFLYGGIAVAAWYLYENWSTLFPSAAAASPSPSPSASGAGAGTAGGQSSSSGSGSAAGAGGGSSPSLASILSGLTAKAMGSGDPAVVITGGVAFANPDVFNYYLAEVYPSGTSSAGWPPDVSQVFPGVDRTKPMSVSQYWAGMSPFLSKAGLSGVLTGLGMLVNAGRQWPELATEPWNGGKWPAGQGWWQGGGRAVQ